MSADKAVSTKLVEAVVARGRTVVDATGERISAGGTAQVLPEEVRPLRELGFLVNPKASPVPVQGGAKIARGAGPMVRLA